ncbi:MAG: hypothetical protein AB1510_00755 [Bacillota bacterium]
MIGHLIFLLISLLLASVLLYPFYLKDHKSARYKGVWQKIGTLFGNRYWVVWWLNFNLGLGLSNVVDSFAFKYTGLIAAPLYVLFSSLIFLWYPFNLKDKKPEKYKGVWKRIGEWIGDPRDAFPNLRK